LRRRIDELIAEGLTGESISGYQQVNHIRFTNGTEIIMAAILRLGL